MLTTTSEPAGASMASSTAPVKALAFTSNTFTVERVPVSMMPPQLSRVVVPLAGMAGQLRGQAAQLGEPGREVDRRALRAAAARETSRTGPR